MEWTWFADAKWSAATMYPIHIECGKSRNLVGGEGALEIE